MSNHLFRILGRFIHTMGQSMSKLPPHSAEYYTTALVFGGGGGCHLAYAYLTKQQETVSVSDKYTMVREGYTEFMVVDNKARHFNVNTSLWYWKWDAAEEWAAIRPGETLHFTYYGVRVPWAGLFPNVVRVARERMA